MLDMERGVHAAWNRFVGISSYTVYIGVAWNQALPLLRNNTRHSLLLRGRGSAWFQASKSEQLWLGLQTFFS